jgi:hypothetical protein
MTALTTSSTAKNICKVVRFDSSVDWKEEDCRTARGFDSRRERKDSKEMANRNLQARVSAVVEILYEQCFSTSLIALARGDRPVRRQLNAFLDFFIEKNDDNIATRLGSFRNLPFNNISDRQTKTTHAILSVLLAIDEFFNTFRAYIPTTFKPRSRRRRTRIRELRQGRENANKRLRRHSIYANPSPKSFESSTFTIHNTDLYKQQVLSMPPLTRILLFALVLSGSLFDYSSASAFAITPFYSLTRGMCDYLYRIGLSEPKADSTLHFSRKSK